jgi:hypothetical protein
MAIRWYTQDEEKLVGDLLDDFAECDGLTVKWTGPVAEERIQVTVVCDVKGRSGICQKYKAKLVKRPLIYCGMDEVVRAGVWGRWLTPLDPGRYEWEGKHLDRKVVRWRRSVDYIYSEGVSAGLLGWIRRLHWQEYIDDKSEYDWEVRTCHETFRGDSPWVLLELDPASYNRSTRIRLRHYLSDE